MTQEEKAKAYDEALERANTAYKDEDRHLKATLERIFPELRESEDEKIKKGLISYFGDFHLQTFAGLDPKKILAWLEKQQKPFMSYDALREGITHVGITQYQIDNWLKKYVDVEKPVYQKPYGQREECYDCQFNYAGECKGYCELKRNEQKPVDNVEPKFEVGQTIKKEGFNSGFTIVKIEDGFYYNDMGDHFPFTDQDNWELVEQKPAYTKEYDFHGIKFIPKFAKGYIIKDKKSGEALTIRDFSYDTGLYTHTYGQFPITIQDNYEIIEPTPSWWSEEDERMLFSAIWHLRNSVNNGDQSSSAGKLEPWIRTLKDRVQSQSKQEWKPTDEQMKILYKYAEQNNYDGSILTSLYKDLKKLK